MRSHSCTSLLLLVLAGACLAQEGTDRARGWLPKLKDPDAGVRFMAVYHVEPLGKEALPSLVPLLYDADPRLRLAALRAIERIGPDEPTVFTNLLDTKDNDLFQEAYKALEKMGTAAMPALVKLLREGDPRPKSWALTALERLGPLAKDAFPVLAESIEKNPGGTAREMLMLARLGTDAIPVLARYVDAPHPTDYNAFAALRSMGAAARPFYRERLRHQDANIREGALCSLSQMPAVPPDDIEAFFAALDDPAENVRSRAVYCLDHKEECLPRLLAALVSPHVDVRKGILRLLLYAEAKVEDLEAGVLPLLDDADAGVRLDTLAVLIKFCPIKPSSIPKAVSLLKDPDPHVRAQAEEWLKQAGPSLAPHVGALLDALDDPDQEVAYRAFECLQTAPKEALAPFLPRLITGLGTIDGRVAYWKSSLLGSLGSDAVPPLLDALSDPSHVVRRHALDALGAMGAVAKGAAPRVLLALKDKSAEVREAAAFALGRLGGESAEAGPALIQGLRDRRTEVQKAAACALATLGKAVRGDLTRVAKDAEEDSDIRAIATRIAADALAPEERAAFLLELAADPEPRVCDAAVDAIAGQKGYEDYFPPVRPGEPDFIVPARRGEPDIATLVQLLSKGGSPARRAVLRCVVAAGNEQGYYPPPSEGLPAGAVDATLVPGFVECLQDHDPEVRAAALKCLCACREKARSAGTAIVALLDSSSLAERKEALRALVDIHANPAQVADKVFQACHDPDGSIRITARETLARIDADAERVQQVLQEGLRDSYSEAPQIAVGELWKYGIRDEEYLPDLMKALTWESNAFLPGSARVLVRSAFRLPKAREAVVQVLAGPDSVPRSRVLEAIGHGEDRSPERLALMVAVLSSPVIKGRESLLGPLIEFGAAAGPSLLQLIGDSDPAFRASLVRAVVGGASSARRGGGRLPEDFDCGPFLDRAAVDSDPSVREAAWGSDSGPAIYSPLRELRPHAVKALADSSPRIRLAAALTLVSSDAPPPEVADILIDAAASKDEATRHWGIVALDRLPQVPPSALHLLEKALSGRDSTACGCAADALSRLGPAAASSIPTIALQRNWKAIANFGPLARDVTPVLTESARSTGGDRYEAIDALPRVADPSEATPLLASLLVDKDGYVRIKAALGLVRLGSPAETSVKVLVGVLGAPSGAMREEAAKGIAEVGPPARAAEAALRPHLRDRHFLARIECAVALARIGADARDACAALVPILTTKDSWCRRRTADALGRMGAPASPALPELEKLLQDEDEDVRQSASWAIQAIQGK